MTIACPLCLERRDPRRRTMACGQCAPTSHPEAGRILGHAAEVRPHGPARQVRAEGGVGDDGGDCPTCRGRMAVEVCALCLQPYPAGWTDLDGTTTVVLAGARYSGKTVYIDVVSACLADLPGQLRDHRVEMLVEPYDTATADADEESRQRMWERFEAAPPTASVATTPPPPLRTYRIVRRDGDGTERTHVLLLRDVAGEDLTHPDPDRARYFSFIGRADLLVFLVDPLQIKGVRDRLENRVAISGTDTSMNPLSILRNVTQLQGDRPRGRTAIVLAKFDTLHSLSWTADQRLSPTMQSPGFAYRRDPGARNPAYDGNDGYLLDAEIRSLLEVLGAGEFLNKVAMQTPTAQFFAVSALGHQPLGQNLAASGITAFRVLDPIKWALAPSRILEPPPAPGRTRGPDGPPGARPPRSPSGLRARLTGHHAAVGTTPQ